MVSTSDILLNNESLSSSGSGLVAALVGATSGIGLSTLQAILKHTTSPTVYVVGRGAARLDRLIAEVQPLNRGATLHAVVAGDLTSVRGAQRAAEEVASRATHLDLLIESQGFFSFRSTPDYTPGEGLDRVTAVRYHSRMRILVTLLPLLRRSRSPRVVSVLGAGTEGPLDLSDLGMTRPETYGMAYAMGASASLTTLFLEELSRRPGNEEIVFIHLYPGLVSGTNLRVPPSTNFLVRWLWDYVAKTVVWVVGRGSQEVGERVLFAATNGRFRRLPPDTAAPGTLVQQGSDGVQGSGAYMVKDDTSVVENGGNAQLKKLREQGAGSKVYEYTMSEFERIEKL
ncbi:uncharacterized protein PV06_02560 [Exophiala oligosperma]|uniref:Ketoreductase (KR) domain-containing protein n=2 Tax=Chaetothyriales TaxID=34395 RepID=A0A0D2DWF8_9EURO|nr:uncharacterized protein PV06_02560 [Exophiala oligosperma]KAJ9624721.1 hypothetical protein H2204_010622 [Knufia peltigerae]KIW46940.1 hypothetical protein PV06_02560 [Exophiala oligosperma]